jgi:1,4-alpha-glucan branching enzyme
MGASVYAGGTTFRVWAPDVPGVAVTGTFNGFGVTPLVRQGNSAYFSLDVPGANHGDKYRFVVTSDGPGDPLQRLDPRAKCLDGNSPTNGGTYGIIWDHGTFTGWTDQSFTMPAPGRQVIYELHLGSFNVPSGGTGTWVSAMAKLANLAETGINVIEVMPPTAFLNAANWGYDILMAHALAFSYGGPDDAKRFINEAHMLGMAVIFDWVPNHMHDATPLSDWEGTSNAATGVDLTFASYNGDIGDGIYFYTGARNQTGYGPRPDFGRKEVRNYWTASMVQFARDYHVDGLRIDSVVTARDADGQSIPEVETWLRGLNRKMQALRLGAISDAEDLQDYSAIIEANGFDFNSQWDDDFCGSVEQALTAIWDQDRDIGAVASAIQYDFDGQAFTATKYTDNHDQVRARNGNNGYGRLSTQIDPANPTSYYARKRALLGGLLVLTSPGRPLLFQGQEFNATERFGFDPPDPLPAPLDWAEATTATGAGILQAYTDVVKLRTAANPVAKGLSGNNTNMFHLDDNNKVLAYHRWDQGGSQDDTIVIHNLSNQTLNDYVLGLPRSGTWKLRVNTDAAVYSPDFGSTYATDVTANPNPQDGLSFNGAVNIGPYSTLILSQDP